MAIGNLIILLALKIYNNKTIIFKILYSKYSKVYKNIIRYYIIINTS